MKNIVNSLIEFPNSEKTYKEIIFFYENKNQKEYADAFRHLLEVKFKNDKNNNLPSNE